MDGLSILLELNSTRYLKASSAPLFDRLFGPFDRKWALRKISQALLLQASIPKGSVVIHSVVEQSIQQSKQASQNGYYEDEKMKK